MPEDKQQPPPLHPRAPHADEIPAVSKDVASATREAMKKIVRVLEALPNDASRSRVIRATAELLDIRLG